MAQLLDARVERDADEIYAALKRLAVEEGEVRALQMLVDRLWPIPKSRRIALDLPKLETLADCRRAQAMVVEAVAAGGITPAEAADVNRVLESWQHTATADDVQRRIAGGGRVLPMSQGKGRLGVEPAS